GGDGGGEKEHKRNSSAGSSPPDGERLVAVPDLELTESRIRLIDKYFGGGDRRRQSFQDKDASNGGTSRLCAGSSTATRPPAFPGIHTDSSTLNHDTASSTREVGVGIQSLESSLSTKRAANDIEVNDSSGQPVYSQDGSLDPELQLEELPQRCKLGSISRSNDKTLAEGRSHEDAGAVCKLEVQR
ncbi:unnamed protein product, partial [Sphacelaria rigidula]